VSHGRVAWPAAVLLALAWLPAASATVVEMNFPADFGRLHVSIVAEVTGGNASLLRQAIDHAGNRDGHASQEEADEVANRHRNELATEFQRAFSGGNVTLDDEPPHASRLNDLRLAGVAAPVGHTGPIAVHIRLDLFFRPAAQPEHTLRIAHPDPGALLVEGPPGHEVTRQSGLGDAQVREDRRVVAGTSGTGPVEVAFAPEGQESPASALAPLALLAAAAARRYGSR
jgi:hypothetical protein